MVLFLSTNHTVEPQVSHDPALSNQRLEIHLHVPQSCQRCIVAGINVRWAEQGGREAARTLHGAGDAWLQEIALSAHAA